MKWTALMLSSAFVFSTSALANTYHDVKTGEITQENVVEKIKAKKNAHVKVDFILTSNSGQITKNNDGTYDIGLVAPDGNVHFVSEIPDRSFGEITLSDFDYNFWQAKGGFNKSHPNAYLKADVDGKSAVIGLIINKFQYDKDRKAVKLNATVVKNAPAKDKADIKSAAVFIDNAECPGGQCY